MVYISLKICLNTDDEFSGTGVKYMKGYKCTLPFDELNSLREEFWSNIAH